VLSQSGVQVSEILVLQAIEDALVRYNRHDVAKSLLFSRGGEAAPVDPLAITTRLMRRNGQVVPWLPNKITTAVRMAFLSLEQDPAPSVRVTAAVTRRVADLGQTIIGIEEVQDLVQEELMRQGHFKVAQNYILYRAYRARRREELAAQPVVVDDRQESLLLVKSADGSTYLWNGDELRKRIAFAAAGLELVRTPDQIESELRRGLFNEITEADLRKTIELNAKSLVEVDADFAKFAARICLSYIYEEVLGWSITRDGVSQLKEFHRAKFAAYVERGIAIGRLSPDLRKYDLAKLAAALDPMADLDFELLGVQTMYDRYLIIDKTVKPARRLETPQFFWMRVAMGLFLREEKNREDWVIRLHALYKSRRFCSSTPTLFNAGTLHSQLSSCYLYQVNDTIESIMIRGIAENAFLSKWAGGLGGSWTSVRGTGSYIKGTNGESQGIIPFLKLHNDQLVAVNQGGKRRGSGCAYLETWHNDIEDFLELRKNTGDDRRRTHDMNTANWIPDLFMKRLKNRQNWTLFLSNETPDLHETFGADFEKRYAAYEERAKKGEIFGKEIPALELWKKMLGMIFETGHPWITFKDPCNVRSPQDHVGVIHSSNLCTEITLNTSAEETAVCNLGSVVLDSHLKADGSIDHAMLRETVTVAVRALDNVIDINFYPTKAAEVSNLRHRPVGMGVMGLQDCLYRRDISFASDAAVEFNDEIMEAVAYYAYDTSADLAAERGTYSTYKGSKWDRGLLPQDTVDLLEQERGEPIEVKRGGRMDWAPVRAKIAKSGMRNSNVLAIAPTATISNIVGSSPCIEPAYKNLFVKSNLSGEFTELNGYLVRDLKKLGLWNQEMMQQVKYFDGELKDIPEIPQAIKDKYLTAFTIENKWLIDAAARRQKWIDQAQSLNLFLPTPDLKMLSHMYQYAWRTGLKTTYYLRTLGASNIEKATVEKAPKADKKEYTAEEKNACSIEAMRNGGTCEACQ
jgi:ribonucleoside-diphosphate reductase alpha chain